MRTLIVFESMYGNTHTVAQMIAEGLSARSEVRVVPVHDASTDDVAWADLVIVGGPTHVHGMTSAASRKSAQDAAAKPDSDLVLDPDSEGLGLRDWFHALSPVTDKRGAAFDTRFDSAALITGRASRGIEHRLRHCGFTLAAEPQSFLVDKKTHLLEGEADRAKQWGTHLLDSYAWPPVSTDPSFQPGVGRTP